MEELIKDSEFAFDYVHFVYYECHQINFKQGESYIDFPNWIKKKKATLNPTNK